MVEFKIVASAACRNDEDSKFWRALDILLDSPHLINRRVAVSSEIIVAELVCALHEMHEWIEDADASSVLNCAGNDSAERCMDLLNANKQRCNNEGIKGIRGTSEFHKNKSYLRVAKLMPRDGVKFSPTIEIALIDKRDNSVTFFHKCPKSEKRTLAFDFPYRLQRGKKAEVRLSVDGSVDEKQSNLAWLKEQMLPKFLKWIENEKTTSSFCSGSLSLVPSERYVLKYDELKKKYGPGMVKMWPESTDPAKFVYEDVAIATYLLLLWDQERSRTGKQELQTFVDLGCGNGLLVHILTGEGHSGVGIDLRKRKIWDFFPDATKLEVRTIIPSSSNLFPESDWLIGNHSDELTPWVPVIAARSSYNCRFFLLPCCAYEFDGRKYQRNDASLSQYFEFMQYVRSISEACGFKTQVDKLRIPSTKRVCFVGSARNYPEELHSAQEARIQEIIHERSRKVASKSSEWSPDFKARDVVEKVRNCTQVDRSLISDIIETVSSHLLKEQRSISVKKNRVEATWNAGGTAGLGELAALLPPEKLKRLKKECGGLQTLLKNNGHVFKVEKGKVQLRNHAEPSSKRRKVDPISLKTRSCWFYAHHPDGCPLPGEECNYRHDRNEPS